MTKDDLMFMSKILYLNQYFWYNGFVKLIPQKYP
jgi:hypothetical protein